MKKTKNVSSKSHKVLIAIIVVAVVAIVAAIVTTIVLRQSTGDENSKTDSFIAIATGDNEINLSDYKKDVRITEAGEYTLSGALSGHSVFIDAKADVTLVLNNVTISAKETAAIANVGTSALNIMLADSTTNTLSDGGSSDYDGALFSRGALTINGNNGALNIDGKQKDGEGIATKSADITIDGGVINVQSADDGLNTGGDGGTITVNGGTLTIAAGGDGIDSNKDAVFNGGDVYVAGSSAGGDAGIDTDSGYVIHGGTLIALGSDMLELPGDNSTQHVVAVALDSSYTSGVGIQLVDAAGNVVIDSNASENFRTIIISSEKISDGNYTLNIDGQAVQTFAVSSIVTAVGDVDMGGPGGTPQGRF